MIKIMTAMNNPIINEELKLEKNIQVINKDIQYKEGILELLEKEKEIDYIIIDEKIPGEIKIENLIEKIIEKNSKIKIIITIKKSNKNIEEKNELKNNEKIIKIFYEKNINIEILKKYNKKNIKKDDKEIEEKNKNKIITFFGERNVGKSITIIKMAYYLISKDCKILLVDLNEENPNICSLLGIENCKQKSIKNKIIIRGIQKRKGIIFRVKYINKKILENKIIKINKKMDLIFYNKLLNIEMLKNLRNKYDYFFIESYLKKNKKINEEILKISMEKILLIKPNLLGIKNSKKIVEKNRINNFKIIINNYNKYSIEEKILKKIFNNNKIIGKINYKEEYDGLINNNFKKLKIKKDKEIEEIIKNII